MIIRSLEPTLAELAVQQLGVETQGTVACLQEELAHIHLLRSFLNTREEGVRKQLEQAQTDLHQAIHPDRIVMVDAHADGYQFNGTSEPACPECTEADGL